MDTFVSTFWGTVHFRLRGFSVRDAPAATSLRWDMVLFRCCLFFELSHADGLGLAVSCESFLAFDGEKGILGLSREVVS